MNEHGRHYMNIRDGRLQDALFDGLYIKDACACLGDIQKHCRKCAACKWFKYCGGGCRVMSMLLVDDTDFLGPDPTRCAFFEKYLHRTMEMFAGYGYKCADSLGD